MPTSNGSGTATDYSVGHPPNGSEGTINGAIGATVVAAAGATLMLAAASGENAAGDGTGILAFAVGAAKGLPPSFYLAYALTMIALAVALVLLLRLRSQQRTAAAKVRALKRLNGDPARRRAQRSRAPREGVAHAGIDQIVEGGGTCDGYSFGLRRTIEAHGMDSCPDKHEPGTIITFYRKGTDEILATGVIPNEDDVPTLMDEAQFGEGGNPFRVDFP